MSTHTAGLRFLTNANNKLTLTFTLVFCLMAVSPLESRGTELQKNKKLHYKKRLN